MEIIVLIVPICMVWAVWIFCNEPSSFFQARGIVLRNDKMDRACFGLGAFFCLDKIVGRAGKRMVAK